MMPFEMVTKDMLKDVLSGKKKFLKMQDVRFCNVPVYDEIGVKALYDDALKMPQMVDYFPDKLPKGKTMAREYFYNVWNTLHPDSVKNVIEYANSQRYAVDNEEVQKNSIIITDEWQ